MGRASANLVVATAVMSVPLIAVRDANRKRIRDLRQNEGFQQLFVLSH